MGRTIQELAAVRDGIRRQWLLPVPPPFPSAPELEDTSEETLKLLAQQRGTSGALARALRSGNPAAIAATAPRPPRGLPRGTGRLASLVGDFDAVTATSDLSFGPIGFPYIIRHIHVAGTNFGAAGSNGEVQLRLFLTDDDLTGDTVAEPGSVIFPTFRGGSSTSTMLKVTGGASVATIIPVTVLVVETGRFLTAVAVMTPAADVRAALAILIEEVDVGEWSLGDLIPAGRIPISAGSRPPVPRLPAARLQTPRTPRGANVRVLQGGQVLTSRIIAWESLDPNLKRLWFNQQVGAPPDPSILWIE